MDSNAVKALLIRFIGNGSSQSVRLNESYRRFKHVGFSYFSYVNNWQNISTSFGNTRLYLNTAGSVFVDLTPGLYDISDINDGVLNVAYSALFYKILTNVNGTSWVIYQYPTLTDRTNNTNGTLQTPSLNLNNGANLNKELGDGSFGPDSFRLYGKFLDVEGNVRNAFDTAILSGLDYINIPITVTRMNRDTLEFIENMTFESNMTSASLELTFYLTDKLGGPITFQTSNPPELLLFFMIDEGAEHN